MSNNGFKGIAAAGRQEALGVFGALAVGLLLLALPAVASTASPSAAKIKVTTKNPYYVLLQTEQRQPVRLGANRDGCRITPYSRCRGVKAESGRLYGA